MKIREDINVQPERLSTGFSSALRICRRILESGDACDEVDLSCTRFATPTFVLPLLVFVNGLDKLGKRAYFSNAGCYLQNIRLDSGGIDSGNMRETQFTAYIEGYSKKTYIPIIKFPSQAMRTSDMGRILSAIETILIKQTGWKSNVVSGIKYMLSEMTDNITEHSKSEYGYIVAQCYPTRQYADICIADTGITVLGSYKEQGRDDIQTDIEALESANKGISTKNLPAAENRGYGIITSREMLVRGLGGQYMMISGKAAYADTTKGRGYIEIPGDIRFAGTIIALRLPYSKDSFRLNDYLE